MKTKLILMLLLVIGVSCSEDDPKPNNCPALISIVNKLKAEYEAYGQTTPQSQGISTSDWNNAYNAKRGTYLQQKQNAENQGCL